MIRTCDACGQKNRVPAERLVHSARCGACKANLGPVHEPIEVGEREFSDITSRSGVPVLVDFWAEWCGPCRAAAPELKQLASELQGRALILKVNVDEQPGLASRYQVQGIPNFAVFKSGQLAFQQAGLVRRAEMRRWLEHAGA
jgi:thioredoxin 2